MRDAGSKKFGTSRIVGRTAARETLAVIAGGTYDQLALGSHIGDAGMTMEERRSGRTLDTGQVPLADMPLFGERRGRTVRCP